MPLPALALDQMSGAMAVLKKGGPLEFCIIPPRAESDPAWIIITRQGRGRATVTAALKAARADGGFLPARSTAGRIIQDQQRLLFVADDAPPSLESRLRERWARALKDSDRPTIKKLAALLRDARVITEDDLAARAPLPSEAEDADEIAQLAGTLSALLAQPDHDAPPDSDDITDIINAALSADAASRLQAVVPHIVQMVSTGAPSDSAPLGVGDIISAREAAMDLSMQHNDALRQRSVWEKWADDAEIYASEVRQGAGSEDSTLHQLHSTARDRAEAARDRAQAAARRVSEQLTALIERQR